MSSNEKTPTKKKKSSDGIPAFLVGKEIFVYDHQDARIIYDNGYYGSLQKDKTLSLNYDEALHLAKLKMIRDDFTALPIFWAAFVLVGR